MFFRAIGSIAVCLIFTSLVGCAASHYAFGTSPSNDPSQLATVDVSGIYGGRSDGFWLYREGQKKHEFVTERTLYLPPGKYELVIDSLWKNRVVTRGNLTIKDSAYFSVPLDVSQGDRIALRREGNYREETIVILKESTSGEKMLPLDRIRLEQ